MLQPCRDRTTNKMLYRAYLLKEQIREVFRVKGRQGRQLLASWPSWASHSGIPELVTLAASIRRCRDLIHNTLDHALSNARSEATDTHLRALAKRAYGFHSPDALIAIALLTRGGLCHQPAEQHETGPTQMSVDSHVTRPIH